MPLSPGDQLGPYEILAPIGEGGMSSVWKARDTRLNRIVAIKQVNVAHAGRFQQEAYALAALNHPHICQIFDVGPDYLVLEYIEGKPLAGPLAPGQTLQIAQQIASALEAAHGHGILHRDLKPANVILTETGAKLLDFGLAKLAESAAPDATRTAEGRIIGTAAYMPPEQALGKQTDARSDIFSFGAVLYELLSGRRAFSGDTILDVLNNVVGAEPPPLDSPLAPVVRKCLAKDPAQRYQTLGDLKAELSKPPQSQPNAKKTSIAVLPFTNMSRGKENEYFSDGLAEEILNLLAKNRDLKVIARTSSFSFRENEQDVRRIAEALGVSNILEGSVRKAGNRIRVTAQLIQATDGSHLWSERYDRELADIFAVQDDIAQAIANALGVQLAGKFRRHVPGLPAYETYLKARHQLAAFTRDSLPQSRDLFKEAITSDADFGAAHSGLAMALASLPLPGIVAAHIAMPLARAAAKRALNIDPALQEAEAVLGIVAALYEFDWNEAARRFQAAMMREPVAPYVRWYYSISYLLPMGRCREAAYECMLGMEGDPLNFLGGFHYAGALLAGGNAQAGEAYLEQLSRFHFSLYQPYYLLALSQAVRGLHKQALTAAENAYSMAPWSTTTKGLFAGLLRHAGDARRATQLYDELLPGDQYGAAMGLSLFHVGCSEMDLAAEWADKAVEQRDTRMIFLISLMRAFQPETLHSSVRWHAIAHTLRIPTACL